MHIPLIIIAVVIISGVGFLFFTQSQPTDTDSSIARVEDTETEISIESNDNNEDKNESETDSDVTNSDEQETVVQNETQTQPDTTTEVFTASASYLTPSRTQHTVDVSLALEGTIVRDVTVLFDGQPEGEFSNSNQERFHRTYVAEVVGKNIADVSLSRVGGASLTSTAFNEAVQTIRNEAS